MCELCLVMNLWEFIVAKVPMPVNPQHVGLKKQYSHDDNVHVNNNNNNNNNNNRERYGTTKFAYMKIMTTLPLRHTVESSAYASIDETDSMNVM